MSAVSNPPDGMPRILPHVIYDNVSVAIQFLTNAFGFRERRWVRHTAADGVIGRTQMDVVDSVITLGTPSVHGDSPRRGVSTMLYVYVDNVDAHYRRVCDAGAEVVMELNDRPWGDRTYQVRDPEGHQWIFAQHVRDVELEEEHLGAHTEMRTR
jgi:PhnB protein